MKKLFAKLKAFIDKWTGRYDYLSLRKPTKRVLYLLDEYDVKATFFVVADVVEHFFIRDWWNQLLKEGMKLEVMGCITRVKNKIDPKIKELLMSVNEFEERTLKAKEMLEKGRVITFIYCKIYFLRGEDR